MGIDSHLPFTSSLVFLKWVQQVNLSCVFRNREEQTFLSLPLELVH